MRTEREPNFVTEWLEPPVNAHTVVRQVGIMRLELDRLSIKVGYLEKVIQRLDRLVRTHRNALMRLRDKQR